MQKDFQAGWYNFSMESPKNDIQKEQLRRSAADILRDKALLIHHCDSFLRWKNLNIGTHQMPCDAIAPEF